MNIMSLLNESQLIKYLILRITSSEKLFHVNILYFHSYSYIVSLLHLIHETMHIYHLISITFVLYADIKLYSYFFFCLYCHIFIQYL